MKKIAFVLVLLFAQNSFAHETEDCDRWLRRSKASDKGKDTTWPVIGGLVAGALSFVAPIAGAAFIGGTTAAIGTYISHENSEDEKRQYVKCKNRQASFQIIGACKQEYIKWYDAKQEWMMYGHRRFGGPMLHWEMYSSFLKYEECLSQQVPQTQSQEDARDLLREDIGAYK